MISSVVLGHILEAMLLDGNRSGFISGSYNSIYLVHMPFYFILSGWLFKGAQPKKKYFIKKCKHLLVPYATWLIIFNIKAIAGLIVNLMHGNLVGEKLLFYQQHFSSQLYGGMEVHGIQMILWFPTCLFFTQQVANLILSKFENKKHVIAIIGTISLVLAYINQYFFPEFYLPLAINIVAGALPFFLIGFYIKMNPPKLSLLCSLVALCMIIFMMIFVYNYSLSYNMRAADYGVPLVSTFAALGGFFIVILFSKYVAQSKFLFEFSKPIGRSSMTIMYLHALILVEFEAFDFTNIFLLLFLGVAIPTLIHLALGSVNVLSKLFLGEKKRLNH